MAGQDVKPDARVEARLEKELIVWFATTGANNRPHVVPVWFWWDGRSFLIYSLPGRKVDDVKRNPMVQLHLNTDRTGDKVVMVDGRAEILKDHAPAYRVGKYLAKYRDRIKGYGWTPKGFSDQYHVAVRVWPSRFRT
ncbi:MAG TPA: TIGR03667 family PPOX class F420-dependent oxidoreductase [Candidatus Dormibacteraeota bacterium]|nr:TIGR03667 family PPOX class F420-dependent oxidoreductase [Candidatus Dormibacteraeota bacterium]